jgi:CheY-like chemotaxis protein
MANDNTDPSSMTIVLVDDDAFTLNLYRKQLERAGFRTVCAPDGLAVINMLPSLAADLIVLDLMLPKVQGLEVLEAIRADSRHQRTPVIILSNAYLPQNAGKAMNAGANGGLLKSECTPTRLLAMIHELLNPGQADAVTPPAHSAPLGQELPGDGLETDRSVDSQPLEELDEATALDTSKGIFLDEWRVVVSPVREHCLNYVKAIGSEGEREHLDELYRSIRSLGARASLGGCTKVAQLTATLEAMLFEQVFKLNGEMSASSVQTVVQAVDCLDHLFTQGKTRFANPSDKPRVLLVDDDLMCNLANEAVLRRANYETVSTQDGSSALDLMVQSAFDLVLLDINMPVVNGFEVCEQLRRIPGYQNTPVLYVTSNDDFQSRARSVLSGANGLITKPISPRELIVKATTFLLRSPECAVQGTPTAAPGSGTRAEPVGTLA